MTKYRDLIQFEPIDSVKHLTEGGDLDQAREDVRTYVISATMRDALVKVLVPNLRFDIPGDHKGIFTVATYGTGKTHLMSVIAGVAEYAELADKLTSAELREGVGPIAGKFKVVRAETSAVKMSLRDILFDRIERGLAGMGVGDQSAPVSSSRRYIASPHRSSTGSLPQGVRRSSWAFSAHV